MSATEGNHLEKKWLVRHGGQIDGPYTTVELEEQILNEGFQVTDEVSAPFCRWRMIRDEMTFAKAIELLRQKMIGDSEDTGTATATVPTHTITRTEEISLDVDEETPVDAVSGMRTIDATVTDRVAAQKGKIRSYGSGTNQDIHQNVNRSISFIWGLSFLIVTVFAFFIYVNKFQGKRETVESKNPLQEGLMAYDLGEYGKAADLLGQAEKSYGDQLDSSVQLKQVFLMIQKGELVLAERKLRKITQKNVSKLEKDQLNIAMGLIKMDLEQYDEAKDLFSQAQEHPSSRFNKGMLEFLQGQYLSAASLFLQVPGDEMRSFLSYALSRVKNAKKARNFSGLEGVLSRLKQFQKRSYNYLLESYLLSAYIAHLLRKTNTMHEFLKKFLNTHPRLTEDHIQPLSIYQKEIQWEKLFTLCNEIYQANTAGKSKSGVFSKKSVKKRDPLVKASYGLCLFMKNDSRAGKILQEAQAEFSMGKERNSPSKDILQSVWAFYLLDSGRKKAAIELLKKQVANGGGKETLPYVLIAHECMIEGDFLCAIKHWSAVLERDKNSVEGLAGLSFSSYQKGKVEQARQLYERGILISPKYRPLHRLETLLVGQ